MCGRYTLRNPQPLKDRFSLENLEKRYNIAPGQRILVVDDKPHLIKWGFTPYWAEKPFNLIGMHGYDPNNMNMHGIFYAYGPSFKTNFNIESFELIHIYPLICNILDIEAYNDIDGDINILKKILN